MNERVLLVEDDESLRETTSLMLQRSGMTVVSESDGEHTLSRFFDGTFDLILLDVMLPSLDGLEVCKEIRRSSNVPVIMLTARTEVSDLVVGLEVGADDYVTKPFDFPLLIARVRAVLRRTTSERQAATIKAGPIEIDPAAFKASKHGERIELSATEFKLLVDLARRPGQVLSREELLRRVWEYEYMGDSRMVDMAVKRVRAKIEDDPSEPKLIVTVRGVGYRFDKP